MKTRWDAVAAACADGHWRTVAEIAAVTGLNPAQIHNAISLQTKNRRSYTIDRRRSQTNWKLKEYRVVESTPREIIAEIESVSVAKLTPTRRVGKSDHLDHLHHHLRFKSVSVDELAAKLTPIVTALKIEGRKNMATMAPAQVAYLAARLQRLLDEWTERPRPPNGTRSFRSNSLKPRY